MDISRTIPLKDESWTCKLTHTFRLLNTDRSRITLLKDESWTYKLTHTFLLLKYGYNKDNTTQG